MVVFESADLDSASYALIDAAWGHQGAVKYI